MSSSALELDLDLPIDSMEPINTTASPSLTVPDHARILLLHSSGEAGEQVKSLFRTQGWNAQIRRSASLQDFEECLRASEWDCVILFNEQIEASFVQISDTVAALSNTGQPNLIFVDTQFSVEAAEAATFAGFSEYLTQAETIRLVFSTAREVFAKQHQRIANSSQNILAEAHAQSKVLLDSTADAISYVADGMIVHANQQLCTLLGYDDSDTLELLPLIDLVDEAQHGKIRQIIKQLNSGEIDQLESTEIDTLNAAGEPVSLTYHFTSASYDGEPCTQIIMRGKTVLDASATADDRTNDEAATTTVASTSHPELPTIPAVPGAELTQLESLQGKGLIAFASLHNSHVIKQVLGVRPYVALAQEVQNTLCEALPDDASVQICGTESWLISIPSSDSNPDHDAGEVADAVVNSINTYLQSADPQLKGSYVALGLARFGVAEFDAKRAMEKAFAIAAELQAQKNGGHKLFSPRIDNAEGSVALQSALELGRFLSKYQPIIGLQNQQAENYLSRLFMLNEHGKEGCAAHMLDSLGLEKDNIAFDQWLIESTINNLVNSASENENTSVIIPLTNAAVNDSEFIDWVSETYARSGLDKKHLAFELTASKLNDYENACRELSRSLQEMGFQVVVSGLDKSLLESVIEIAPNMVMLAEELTHNLNADAEVNTREELKEIISTLNHEKIVCVATGVSSASELAVLWQTNVPYVMGDYLQSPLNATNYEFTDLS